MNGVRGGMAALAALMVLSGLTAGPAEDLPAPRPVDRWLVATVPAADSLAAPDHLATDLLAAPGEAGVLPDRGLLAGGATWRLVRREGHATLPLDSIFPDAEAGTVAYAHAYLRLPADRTYRLDVTGVECTSIRARVNGRDITGTRPAVRFGGGWNTLLVKAVAGDCPFGLRAEIEASDIGAGGETDRAAGMPPDILVQASRPPGNVRTGPDDWVVPADTARVGEARLWRGDRLYAGLAVGLTAWGRGPVSDVRIELRDGADGRATAAWLVPGRRDDVAVPVRLDRLDRLLSSGRIGVRVDWGDERIDRQIAVTGRPPDAAGRIVLDGWEVRRASGLETGARGGGRLPNASGWILEGEWEVPDALAGRELVLETDASPGEYALNGTSPAVSDERDGADGGPDADAADEGDAAVEGGAIVLCSPCGRGLDLRIAVTSTGAWESFPAVRSRAGTRGE